MFTFKNEISFCYKSLQKQLTLKSGTPYDSIKFSICGLFQIPYDKELEFYDEQGNKLVITSSLKKNKIYVTIKGEPSNIKKKLSLRIKYKGKGFIRINVEPTDTIENIKKIIFENSFVKPEKLFIGSRVQLEDNKTINDYGIKDEDVLYMTIKDK